MKVGHSGTYSTQNSEASSAKSGSKAAASQEAGKSERSAKTKQINTPSQAAVDSRTELSTRGKEFARAKAVANDTPDVREDRVADLKRRIAEGSYQVDSEAIADRLVDDHLRLPGIG